MLTHLHIKKLIMICLSFASLTVPLISNLNSVMSLQEHENSVVLYRGVLMYWIVRYLDITGLVGMQVDITYMYIGLHID